MRLERLALRKFPHFQFIKIGRKLGVRGKIYTRFGNIYDLKIIFPDNYPNSAPDAYCTNHNLKKAPHILSEKRLCYHYKEWRPKYTIAVAIGWAADWFDAYDHWRNYGEWRGIEY